MEEKTTEDDIIYDLTAEEHAESAEGQGAQESSETSDSSDESETSDYSEISDYSDNSDNSDNSENSDYSDNSDNSETSDYSDNSDISEHSDPHEEELRRLTHEMGAETLLSIIKDNRNAAIRQILSEVEATRKRDMPTGASASAPCSSIFDLAALA